MTTLDLKKIMPCTIFRWFFFFFGLFVFVFVFIFCFCFCFCFLFCFLMKAQNKVLLKSAFQSNVVQRTTFFTFEFVLVKLSFRSKASATIISRCNWLRFSNSFLWQACIPSCVLYRHRPVLNHRMIKNCRPMARPGPANGACPFKPQFMIGYHLVRYYD